MKIVGYVNKVSSGGNPGVQICMEGEYSEYDTKEAKEVKGIKAETVYVSGQHLKPEDIGKEIIAYRRRNKDGQLYCSGVKID
jgi:hypothetical protein